MHKLGNRIEAELKEQQFCAVYDSDLARVWPTTIKPEKRKQQIERFARKEGLTVTFYDIGLCAIFEKADQAARRHRAIAALPLRPKKSTTRKRRK
jgi:hypothetical protein